MPVALHTTATGALSGPNLQVLASDLHLIASAVRFLDTSAHEAAAAAAGAGAPLPALKVRVLGEE